ncbi:MAG: dethiobiotin synthase [Propionivibrio sp.]|jgi:dethiobiotin synthase|nr:dethiobiotin synthase [Propionivibrio sp.]MBP6709656.1 dethiobiotin synthase [Propionivibrio sp.]
MIASSTAPTPASAWFITGTDTEVGKTFATSALLLHLKSHGIKAVGMKPIAAGTNEKGRNEDVEALVAASGVQAPRELVNPYLFHPAIAPHIAASEEGRTIDIDRIVDSFDTLRGLADAVLVEGVGGFCVPLGPQSDSADLAEQLGLPVILVVGMRLGCINHALLTQQAIAARGLKLAGWIANRIDPAMSRFDENLATLKTRINAPLLGAIPANSTPDLAAKLLTLGG